MEEHDKRLKIMMSIFSLYNYKPKDVVKATDEFVRYIILANAIVFNRHQYVMNLESTEYLKKQYNEYMNEDTDMICDLAYLSVADLEGIMKSIETYKDSSFTLDTYKPTEVIWWRANLEAILGNESITLNEIYDNDFWMELDWISKQNIKLT